MKKTLLLSTSILLISVALKAQTNTFPATGNVGIGTTNPGYSVGNGTVNASTLLDIYNSANSSSTILRLSGTGEAAGNYTGILLGAGGLQGRGRGAMFFEPYGTSYGIGRLHFAVNQTAGEGEATLADVKMTILGNGNIGIGTTSPHTPLDVTGGASTTSISNTATTVTTRINTANPAVSLGIGYVPSDNPMLQAFNNVNNTANSLLINPYGGNVGIGITDPGSYKLAVNGTIHSKAVIIDLVGWPDYVFKKGYKLMPLAQVRSYIDQNQHLPGLPTDKEVEAKGLDVGEMNKLLTKKVEELTLYLIEKDKELNEQKQVNKLQDSRLVSVESQLKLLMNKK